MAIKYYYMDDEPVATIKETAKGLSTTPQVLKIVAHQHKTWKGETEFLLNHQEEFDGLLLDWALTHANEENQKADFGVEALAQQFRRYAIGSSSKIKKDFPIVLCSADSRFEQIFPKEKTGHDLFDQVYAKKDFREDKKRVVAELVALANGYKLIQAAKNLAIGSALKKILGIHSGDHVDYRIQEHLQTQLKNRAPVHEIARFVLDRIVRPQGALIDAHLLAARLGVDIANTPNKNWNMLLETLKKCKYTGAFCKAWERWWMELVNDWWDSVSDIPLGTMTGGERVRHLNKKLKLELVPAQKTSHSKSDLFWQVCQISKAPIAIEDGVLAEQNLSKMPWQEDGYYCIEEALKLETKQVHPLEKDRLRELKKLHTKKRKK